MLRVASEPSVKLVGRKSALTTHPLPPSVVYSTDRSVVPLLLLLFVACGLFYEAICFKSCLVLFISCIFQFF